MKKKHILDVRVCVMDENMDPVYVYFKSIGSLVDWILSE